MAIVSNSETCPFVLQVMIAVVLSTDLYSGLESNSTQHPLKVSNG